MCVWMYMCMCVCVHTWVICAPWHMWRSNTTSGSLYLPSLPPTFLWGRISLAFAAGYLWVSRRFFFSAFHFLWGCWDHPFVCRCWRPHSSHHSKWFYPQDHLPNPRHALSYSDLWYINVAPVGHLLRNKAEHPTKGTAHLGAERH